MRTRTRAPSQYTIPRAHMLRYLRHPEVAPARLQHPARALAPLVHVLAYANGPVREPRAVLPLEHVALLLVPPPRRLAVQRGDRGRISRLAARFSGSSPQPQCPPPRGPSAGRSRGVGAAAAGQTAGEDECGAQAPQRAASRPLRAAQRHRAALHGAKDAGRPTPQSQLEHARAHRAPLRLQTCFFSEFAQDFSQLQ